MNTQWLIRAALISAAAYVVTFILAIVVTIVFALFAQLPLFGALPMAVIVVGMATSVAVTALCAWWFFRSPIASPSARTGAYFGACVIGVGIVLDMLTVLPFGNPVSVLASYYLQPLFVVTLTLMLAAAALVGHLTQRRSAYAAEPKAEPKTETAPATMSEMTPETTTPETTPESEATSKPDTASQTMPEATTETTSKTTPASTTTTPTPTP